MHKIQILSFISETEKSEPIWFALSLI